MVLEKFARLRKTEQTGESRDWLVNVLVERKFYDIYDRYEKKSKKIYLKRIVIFLLFFCRWLHNRLHGCNRVHDSIAKSLAIQLHFVNETHAELTYNSIYPRDSESEHLIPIPGSVFRSIAVQNPEKIVR